MTDILPNALMIGVDYELFWTLNPKSLSPFIKAFDLKQKYDDSSAWILGGYIQRAIASVLNKDSKYPQRPLSNSLTLDEESRKNEIKQKFLNRMELLNSRYRKEGQGE